MASGRSGAVGQSLDDASPRPVRSQRAPGYASDADQERDASHRMRIGKLGAPTVVLALLCAMYFLYFVDRVSISTAAPLIKRDLGISNTQLGLAFSAFAIPYALFQLIGGWVGDKLGPRLTLSACCAMVGLTNMF